MRSACAKQLEVDPIIVRGRQDTAERLLRAFGGDLGRRPAPPRRSPVGRQLELVRPLVDRRKGAPSSSQTT